MDTTSQYTLPLLILLSLQISSFAKDNITAHQILKDPETLVSTNGSYALGFFSPGNSTSRYLGIWYNKVSIKDYVWVANRDKPINDSSGWLRISNEGNLQVLNGQNNTLWSSNISNQPTPPTGARLLDTGDFVLMVGSTIIWQTSEHATDTLLQNLNFTITPESDPKRVITSWKSPSDPSTGRFYCGTDSLLLPQFVIWDGGRKYFRSGPWNGNNFIGIQNNFVEFINAAFVILSNPKDQADQQIMTAEYAYPTNQYFSNVKLNYKGAITQPFWNPGNESWVISWQAPATHCDLYATCGAFGSCNSLRSGSICSCLKGFEPKNKEEWGNGNWTGGCVRKRELKCGGDGFWKLANMKIPDNAELVRGLSEDGCRRQCLNNCTCLAYAYDSGIGCMVWSGSLIDVQEFSTSGVDLYIRLTGSELGSKMRKNTVIAISVAVWTVVGVFVVGFGWWLMVRRQGRREDMKKDVENKTGRTTNINVENLPVFEYKDLAIATNSFQQSNKLGQGGFGPVYRGKLVDGQEIAVKRLSEVSGQGVEEFMNEVTVISKLQHRNLVRLLGCCVEGEDKMLIYEYMPNKSLDAFIFDIAKREALSWQVISNIIEGICRGLLYLHRDSRVKIIHRDLKASNVLLDKDLNPKISDFGMARIFWVNQDQDSTRRIVGTYGYMSPEYAMEGRISEKSDVYSFGVLVIEIITGLQNNKFLDADGDEDLTLIGYAWKMWKEGKIESLIDQRVSSPRPQMVKCLHVGLLCVQEFVVDRPSFTGVMAMLNDEVTNLPEPRQPGFMLRHNTSSDSGISQRPCSINDVSLTEMDGR